MNEQHGSSVWLRVFGLDLRALAVFRMGISLVCLYDLAERAAVLGPHYTDTGVVRRADLLSGAYYWTQSFHFYSGTWWGQAALFVLAAAAAVCLLVGYRTWTATFVVYLLTLSVQNRNPLIIHGADEALRVLLFWGLFLPLGARWSVDRLRDMARPVEQNDSILTGGTVAYTLQIAFIYFFAGLLKTGEAWQNGDAVYYTLHAELYTRPMAEWLLAFPGLLPWATWATRYLEILGPLLLFCPIFAWQVRLLAIGLFMGLHLGMWLFVNVGLWPWVMVAGLAALVPTEFWNWIEQRAFWKRISGRIDRLFRDLLRRWGWGVRAMPAHSTWPASALALFLIVYVAAWNIELLDDEQKLPDWPESVRWPGLVTGLDQKWQMFAPNPIIDDGWFVVDAQLASGRSLDLMTGKPPTFDKPDPLPTQGMNYRWRMYQKWLWQRRDELGVHRAYARWICEQWQRQHDEEDAITDLRMYYVVERTPPPGEQPPPLAKVLVFEYDNPDYEPLTAPQGTR